MIRRRKLVLLLVVAPVALVLLLVIAALTPAVQTFVARRVLADQGSVEHVSVGAGGAEIRGLVLDQAGVKVAVPSVRAELPLVTAAAGKIDVHALVARDVVIDYDPVAAADYAKKHPTPGSGVPARPFEGILKLATLPELQVDGLDFSGVLRVAGARPLTANFTLTGGGVSAGKEGRIELKITAKAEKTADVVTTLELLPTLDASGQLSALALKLDATAKGGLLAKTASVRAEGQAVRESAGEAWSLRLFAGEKALVELDTQWTPGLASLPGRWKLDLSEAELKPFLSALPFITLPAVKLAGAGELAIAGTERVKLSGDLRLDADALETLGLPALGPVTLAARLDVEADTAEVKVGAFRLDVAAASSPVLALESKQAFTFSSATRKIVAPDPASELFSVRLLGVPPAWVAAFVPVSDLSLGSSITGVWSVRPEGDGAVVSSTAPLAVNAVRYGPANAPLAQFDTVQVDGLRARLGPAGLEATVDRLRVVAGGADLATGKLSARQKTGEPLSAHAEFSAQLAVLADQPLLRGQTRLSAGQALLILDATVAEAKKAAAELRLTGLRAGGADLPAVLLQADVTQDAAGVLSAKLPLTVENPSPKRISDLEISATVTPGAKETRVAAKLLSQVLHVPDLEAFAALASDAPAAPKAAATPAAGQPVKPAPLWKGVSGELGLSLARIVYVPGLEIENTTGRVAITEDAVTLEKLQALFSSGGRFAVTGALRWLAAGQTYTLAADVKGDDVTVGPVLKALDPAAAVPLEGTYALSAKVEGRGTDPGAAAAGAAADLRINGKQGVLRALDLDTNKYAKAGSTVAGFAGLAGALSGNPELAKYGARVTALNNVARQFSNLAYDEFSLVARRGADGAVEIGELKLSSPKLRLDGAGDLKNLPGRNFVQQPLNLKLELGARDTLARDLATLGLLDANQGTEPAGDYAKLAETVVLDGTLQKIGTDQLMRLLTRALGR